MRSSVKTKFRKKNFFQIKTILFYSLVIKMEKEVELCLSYNNYFYVNKDISDKNSTILNVNKG